MTDALQSRPPKFSVFIPGHPVAWARARVSRSGGFFTAPKQRAYRVTVQSCAKRARKHTFGSEPVSVCIEVYLPQAKSNKDRLPVGRNTCDVDNWAKMILDALNGITWDDDAQVVHLQVSKRWAREPLEVGAWVHIQSAD